MFHPKQLNKWRLRRGVLLTKKNVRTHVDIPKGVFKSIYSNDVSCGFDKFRVDTHLCKRRKYIGRRFSLSVCESKPDTKMTLYYNTYHA